MRSREQVQIQIEKQSLLKLTMLLTYKVKTIFVDCLL